MMDMATETKIPIEVASLLKMAVLSFLIILVAGFFLYLFGLKNAGSLASKIPFMAYAVLSSVAITASIAHYHSHRTQFTCMEGMMVGMTIGMVAGFLFGAIVGATNGMFMGSVFGMAAGMLTGAYAGKCCGIMGIMEGLMAGLMGGTMGAMLSVMMLNDNLALFMPILLASCLAILAGLAYMVHTTAGMRDEGKLMPFANFLAISFALAAITVVVIAYAPRAGLVV